MNNFCSNCGNKLNEGVKFCSGCGSPVNENTSGINTQSYYTHNQQRYQQQFPSYNPQYDHSEYLVNELISKLKTLGIIWCAIAVIQVLLGIVMINEYYDELYCILLFVCAFVNIIFSIQTFRFSNKISFIPVGILKRYSSIGAPLTTLIYNILFGGLIGVIGSIYMFVVRNFVVSHEHEFYRIEELALGKAWK